MIALVSTVALFIGLVFGAVFLVFYAALVPGWWREEHRAHVVAFSANVVGFFLLYVLRPLIDPGVFQWIRLFLLLALVANTVWRTVIFLRGLLRRRRLRRG